MKDEDQLAYQVHFGSTSDLSESDDGDISEEFLPSNDPKQTSTTNLNEREKRTASSYSQVLKKNIKQLTKNNGNENDSDFSDESDEYLRIPPVAYNPSNIVRIPAKPNGNLEEPLSVTYSRLCSGNANVEETGVHSRSLSDPIRNSKYYKTGGQIYPESAKNPVSIENSHIINPSSIISKEVPFKDFGVDLSYGDVIRTSKVPQFNKSISCINKKCNLIHHKELCKLDHLVEELHLPSTSDDHMQQKLGSVITDNISEQCSTKLKEKESATNSFNLDSIEWPGLSLMLNKKPTKVILKKNTLENAFNTNIQQCSSLHPSTEVAFKPVSKPAKFANKRIAESPRLPLTATNWLAKVNGQFVVGKKLEESSEITHANGNFKTKDNQRQFNAFNPEENVSNALKNKVIIEHSFLEKSEFSYSNEVENAQIESMDSENNGSSPPFVPFTSKANNSIEQQSRDNQIGKKMPDMLLSTINDHQLMEDTTFVKYQINDILVEKTYGLSDNMLNRNFNNSAALSEGVSDKNVKKKRKKKKKPAAAVPEMYADGESGQPRLLFGEQYDNSSSCLPFISELKDSMEPQSRDNQIGKKLEEVLLSTINDHQPVEDTIFVNYQINDILVEKSYGSSNDMLNRNFNNSAALSEGVSDKNVKKKRKKKKKPAAAVPEIYAVGASGQTRLLFEQFDNSSSCLPFMSELKDSMQRQSRDNSIDNDVLEVDPLTSNNHQHVQDLTLKKALVSQRFVDKEGTQTRLGLEEKYKNSSSCLPFISTVNDSRELQSSDNYISKVLQVGLSSMNNQQVQEMTPVKAMVLPSYVNAASNDVLNRNFDDLDVSSVVISDKFVKKKKKKKHAAPLLKTIANEESLQTRLLWEQYHNTSSCLPFISTAENSMVAHSGNNTSFDKEVLQADLLSIKNLESVQGLTLIKASVVSPYVDVESEQTTSSLGQEYGSRQTRLSSGDCGNSSLFLSSISKVNDSLEQVLQADLSSINNRQLLRELTPIKFQTNDVLEMTSSIDTLIPFEKSNLSNLKTGEIAKTKKKTAAACAKENSTKFITKTEQGIVNEKLTEESLLAGLSCSESIDTVLFEQSISKPSGDNQLCRSQFGHKRINDQHVLLESLHSTNTNQSVQAVFSEEFKINPPTPYLTTSTSEIVKEGIKQKLVYSISEMKALSVKVDERNVDQRLKKNFPHLLRHKSKYTKIFETSSFSENSSGNYIPCLQLESNEGESPTTKSGEKGNANQFLPLHCNSAMDINHKGTSQLLHSQSENEIVISDILWGCLFLAFVVYMMLSEFLYAILCIVIGIY